MTRQILLAAILLATNCAVASAQTCVGLPTAPGGFAPRAILQVGSGPTSYGADVVANLTGPLLVGASFLIDDREGGAETGQTFGARLGYELPFSTSVCLLLDPNYSTYDADPPMAPPASVKILRVPLLVGVGQRLALTPDIYVIPAARGGFMYRSLNIESEGDLVDLDEHENEVVIAAGATIGRGSTFANAEVMVTTETESETRVTIGVGIILP